MERAADGRYSIGPLIWRMGILAPTHDVIGRGARPLLISLSARTSSDVRVLSYFDEAARCVDEILTVSAGPNDATRLAALQETARSLTAILNDRMIS